jgi:hypothetical protein
MHTTLQQSQQQLTVVRCGKCNGRLSSTSRQQLVGDGDMQRGQARARVVQQQLRRLRQRSSAQQTPGSLLWVLRAVMLLLHLVKRLPQAAEVLRLPATHCSTTSGT